VGIGYGSQVDSKLGYDWKFELPFQDVVTDGLTKAWTEGGARWRLMLRPLAPLRPIRNWVMSRAVPILRWTALKIRR
jgi:hypothetical protein